MSIRAIHQHSTPRHHDKYGRLLGSVTLADGRDWASTMITAGMGRAYGTTGSLHKAPWCADPTTPAQ